MAEPQTYANHRRLEPIQHFFVTPVLLITCFGSMWMAFKHPTLHSLWFVILAFALLLGALSTRMYALKVQDRLIRLEETLRMQRLLAPECLARLGELEPKQFVALRFASDAELAERVREALDEKLDGEAIKKRVQAWRPDTFRV